MRTEIFRERVLPSWQTFAMAPLLAIFLYGVWLPINEIAGVVTGLVAAIVLIVLFVIKAPVISVTDVDFTVGRATIRRSLIGKVEHIPKSEAFKARGVELDARAYTCFQASVGEMLRVEIVDPADPTPYWLFNSRETATLISLLS